MVMASAGMLTTLFVNWRCHAQKSCSMLLRQARTLVFGSVFAVAAHIQAVQCEHLRVGDHKLKTTTTRRCACIVLRRAQAIPRSVRSQGAACFSRKCTRGHPVTTCLHFAQVTTVGVLAVAISSRRVSLAARNAVSWAISSRQMLLKVLSAVFSADQRRSVSESSTAGLCTCSGATARAFSSLRVRKAIFMANGIGAGARAVLGRRAERICTAASFARFIRTGEEHSSLSTLAQRFRQQD